MAIELFSHNQVAYEAAVKMLSESRKAVIIHPTGTGKSFIGFKLCEEHPEKQICWLSPSEYIFQTQIENLKAAADGFIPKNIRFYTYAKLRLLTNDELAEIQPDYIILDEFHRCGAQMWGQGVQRLLQMYPKAPILGMSATNIRYLDNQRNMAEELFDAKVASEITLGEAIVRGILSPPKYVLSVFRYQNELEKLEQRVKNAKNAAVQEAAEKYLDALKRTLEKADGLEQVFVKHMENRSGKYIVFCANKDHMDDMIAQIPEWFHQIDQQPHVYSVYSEDSEAEITFSRFKEDNSDHLKLLYCIDMLNEGIHVDNVDGVILLRPTVSPIIYKQQIGRALSAGKQKGAVIFDIVLNIENLYSIGSIEEEMNSVLFHYRSEGRDHDIVNEQFNVIDEVKDCMELFEKLNDSLTASWHLMYHYAQQYRQEHGHLNIPKRYITEEGYCLGAWLATQRRVYEGKTSGILSDEQIKLLEQLGICWSGARDVVWQQYYDAAKKYYEAHGHLLINSNASNKEEARLARWIAQLRNHRKSGNASIYLTEERIAALDQIGMVWDALGHQWEKNYAAAIEYHRQHGNLDVPADYISREGVRLGKWLFAMRAARKGTTKSAPLTPEQIARLDALGFNWSGKFAAEWERSYLAARKYMEEHGNLNIPVAYVTEEGCNLGRWIRRQKNASLSEERRRKLEAIGMF